MADGRARGRNGCWMTGADMTSSRCSYDCPKCEDGFCVSVEHLTSPTILASRLLQLWMMSSERHFRLKDAADCFSSGILGHDPSVPKERCLCLPLNPTVRLSSNESQEIAECESLSIVSLSHAFYRRRDPRQAGRVRMWSGVSLAGPICSLPRGKGVARNVSKSAPACFSHDSAGDHI